MIYVLTEWDGKGNWKITFYRNKRDAMASRECKLTYNAALKKYGASYFYKLDIKCTTIDSYASLKAMQEGKIKTTKNWY